MDIQRLRNLTTGRLHTCMPDIYEDIETLTRLDGIITHQIPNAMRALEPWLRQVVTDARFWDGKYDPSHVGQIDLPEMTEADQDALLDRFASLPSPLIGRTVAVVTSN